MPSRAGIIRKQTARQGHAAKPLKIVVTGPFAAGKTTLIQTISEVAIVGTDRDVSDETRAVKHRTTVAMDFGRLTFASDLSLYLFGTPGQRRFEVMWEILSEGMIGFILLVHAGDRRSVEEGAAILATFREYADVPFVVGVTHLDLVDEPQDSVFTGVRASLGVEDSVQVMACDPRRREDVKRVMLTILLEVMQRLERANAPVA